jgi:hypothetical protein
MMSKLPANAVGVMDRGFAGLKFIQELVQNNKYFVLRIKNNWKLEFESESRLTKIGSSTDAQAYRIDISHNSNPFPRLVSGGRSFQEPSAKNQRFNKGFNG